MPEIGEVHRICHFLRKHAVGHTIAAVRAQDDPIVYGKVGTSAEAFKKAMTGKKVVDVRQQGKYFWLEMASPPHPLMHLGMTGWIKFSNDDTSHYRPKKAEAEEWPPKFWKFVLELDGDEKCEIAFVDARRLARIRLVDAKGEDMRKTTPLKENGPDPYIDADILTVDWLAKKLRSKKVPVKALLLDQGNISGVGNWVADEVLYQAKIHPEQYSNTFSDAQIKQLHDSLTNVCKIACETLAESDKFPETWLMKHRWSKGKGSGSKLPNGAKIIFLTVGGRTSAVVPSVQKKTGEVSQAAKEAEAKAKAEDEEDGEEVGKKAKSAGKKGGLNGSAKVAGIQPTAKRSRDVKVEEPQEAKSAPSTKDNEKRASKKAKTDVKSEPQSTVTSNEGRRRSGRVARK